MPIETVICFDRDLTVDINPPTDKEAVPLALVKYLAHKKKTVDVWATGNRHLSKEASIPGTREAIELWEELYDKPVSDVYSYRHPKSTKLVRKDRMRLIHDLYKASRYTHQSIRFIVVDDTDVSDLEDWEYYTAWDFMDSVRRGEFSFTDDVGNFSNVPAHSNNCNDLSSNSEIDLPVSIKTTTQ